MGIMMITVVVNFMMVRIIMVFPSPGVVVSYSIPHFHFAGGQKAECHKCNY
jgi:hypothetical protein